MFLRKLTVILVPLAMLVLLCVLMSVLFSFSWFFGGLLIGLLLGASLGLLLPLAGQPACGSRLPGCSSFRPRSSCWYSCTSIWPLSVSDTWFRFCGC